MTKLWHWFRKRHSDGLEEAKAALEAARQVEPEIEQLGAELRRLQRQNHFSPLVQEAIRRKAKEA